MNIREAQDFARIMQRTGIPRGCDWRERCWEWRGATTKQRRNYPVAVIDGVWSQIHRWVLTVTRKGPWGGRIAGHSCDNQRCINPGHLTRISQSKNIKDWWRRRR